MKTTPTKPTQPCFVPMNGKEYAWDSKGGLDPAIALEVEGFVRKKAAFYVERAKNARLEYNDLVQEGMAGALKAAGKYRPDMGANYLTYAAPWIEAALKEALPRPLARTPDGQPLAQVWALDAPGGGGEEDDGPNLGDWQRADQPDPHHLSMAAEDRSRVQKALPKLNSRDREVLVRYAGLCGRKEQKLSEIALDMGITRQRAGQLLDRARADLRLHLGGRTV